MVTRKGVIWALVVVALFSGCIPAAAQDGQSAVIRGGATACVRLRGEPSADAEQQACLTPGMTATVTDTVPFWRKVRLPDGREGWVAKKFLEPTAAPAPVTARANIPANAWLEVHFVDVGQGDGIWIHTFDDGIQGNGIFEGKNVIIDGGPDASDAKNALLIYVRKYAHEGAVIDALIVTHPHYDHYPGADGILRHFQVLKYYDPGYPKETRSYQSFLAEARTRAGNGDPANVMIGKDRFDQLDWGREITAEILYAYPGSPDGLGVKSNTVENNSSIVLRLVYGKHVFLFMGDAEGKDRNGSPTTAKFVERILLDTVPREKLKATVLKIAHHGSETASTLPFINAVAPQIVVVPSGRKNFGHRGTGQFLPDLSTLRRYCCHNPEMRIYRTDQDDAEEGRTEADDADGDNIVIRTNGSTLEVNALEGGHPFTPNACEPACRQ